MPKHEETRAIQSQNVAMATGFNEASCRSTRKPSRGTSARRRRCRFNEASCRSTRKRERRRGEAVVDRGASMRPRAEARGNSGKWDEMTVAEMRLQ